MEIKKKENEIKYHEYMGELKGLIRHFREDAYDPGKEYLAFRRYVVKNLKLFIFKASSPMFKILPSLILKEDI